MMDLIFSTPSLVNARFFLFNHKPENEYELINGNSAKKKKRHSFIKTQRIFKPELTKT